MKPKRSDPDKQKLTDTVVRRLKPPRSGRRDHWHVGLAAFGVRITSNGVKSWIVAIRRPGVLHPVRIKIGDAATMAFKEAHRLAADALADPAAFFAGREPAKVEPVSDYTFLTLATQFLAHGHTKRGRPWRATTKREHDRALLVTCAGLHGRMVADIHRRDAAALIREVAAGSTSAAMKTRAAGMRFYGWLISEGLVEHNPFTGTTAYATPKRSRVLTDAELCLLWQATEEPSDFALIVRLLIWLGARRGEVGSMTWSELQDGLWTVDGARIKNHRTLTLPLPRQALAALDAWPRIKDRDLLFGRADGFEGWSAAKARLDAKIARLNAEKRLGRKLADGEKPATEDAMAPWSLHDLRRSVETRLTALGIGREVVTRTLNHAMGPIEEAYNRHDYLREKQDALQRWADRLDAIVGGNVVDLAARA